MIVSNYMKTIAQFKIYKDDSIYIAEGVDLAIVTQAKTLDELTKNIQEAVEVYFHDNDMKKASSSTTSSILANIELPAHV